MSVTEKLWFVSIFAVVSKLVGNFYDETGCYQYPQPLLSLHPSLLCLPPHLSFYVSHPISPLAPPPSISPLCLMLQPFHQKENGKTANPAACYGIRVYQPIMPFSDLFSSQDLALCACIPPPPNPPPFPYHPTKAADAIFSAPKPPATLPHHHQPLDC